MLNTSADVEYHNIFYESTITTQILKAPYKKKYWQRKYNNWNNKYDSQINNKMTTAEEQISELENQKKEAVQKVAGKDKETFRDTEKEIEG